MYTYIYMYIQVYTQVLCTCRMWNSKGLNSEFSFTNLVTKARSKSESARLFSYSKRGMIGIISFLIVLMSCEMKQILPLSEVQCSFSTMSIIMPPRLYIYIYIYIWGGQNIYQIIHRFMPSYIYIYIYILGKCHRDQKLEATSQHSTIFLQNYWRVLEVASH